MFLCRHVLGHGFDWIPNLVRAKRPEHVTVVPTRDEVALLLANLGGPEWLVASLLYGAGLKDPLVFSRTVRV